MVIADVLPDQSPQMYFIEWYDVVKQLAAAASDPAFRDPVLPGRLNARTLRGQSGGFQELNHISIECGVAVEHNVAVWFRLRECLSQLLHDPVWPGNPVLLKGRHESRV